MAKGTYKSKVGKRYLKVQGCQKVSKGSSVEKKVSKGKRLTKDTYRSKVSKRHIKVKSWQEIPKGPWLAKAILMSNVVKG